MSSTRAIVITAVVAIAASCGGGSGQSGGKLAELESDVLAGSLLWCEDRAFMRPGIMPPIELKDPTTSVQVQEVTDVDRANGIEYKALIFIQSSMVRSWDGAGGNAGWYKWEKNSKAMTFRVVQPTGGELELQGRLSGGGFGDPEKACSLYLEHP